MKSADYAGSQYNVPASPCVRLWTGSSMRAGEKRPLSLRILGSLALALSRNLSTLPNRRLAGIQRMFMTANCLTARLIRGRRD